MRIEDFNQQSDYEQALQLWRQSAPGIVIGFSDNPEEIHNFIVVHHGIFIVARNDLNTLVGTAMGGFDGRRGMIYHLAVLPEYRRCGVGKMLMDELETRLKLLGCKRCYLMVASDNADVVEYYTKLGWQCNQVIPMAKNLMDD